jgi:hypothetical protein
LIIGLKDCSKRNANDIKQIGGYCIQVESVGPQGREFLVHMHSSMNLDGYFSGTKLISSMTENLQCLEEKRTEYSSYMIKGSDSDILKYRDNGSSMKFYFNYIFVLSIFI